MKHTALLLAVTAAALTACNKGKSLDLQGGEAIIVKAYLPQDAVSDKPA